MHTTPATPVLRLARTGTLDWVVCRFKIVQIQPAIFAKIDKGEILTPYTTVCQQLLALTP